MLFAHLQWIDNLHWRGAELQKDAECKVLWSVLPASTDAQCLAVTFDAGLNPREKLKVQSLTQGQARQQTCGVLDSPLRWPLGEIYALHILWCFSSYISQPVRGTHPGFPSSWPSNDHKCTPNTKFILNPASVLIFLPTLCSSSHSLHHFPLSVHKLQKSSPPKSFIQKSTNH